MTTHPVEIRLLGPCSVRVGADAPLSRSAWGTRASLQLVALLAVAPAMRLGAGELQRALWPGADPARGAASLRTAVYHARRALGRERILREGDDVALTGAWCDVPTFRALAESVAREAAAGRPDEALAALDRAAALRAGPIHDVLSSHAATSWRHQTEAAWVEALLHGSALALAQGRPTAARDMAAAAIGSAPFGEDVVQAVVAAEVARGDAARAIAAIDEFRRRLRDELGVSGGWRLDATRDLLAGRSPETGLLLRRPHRENDLDAAWEGGTASHLAPLDPAIVDALAVIALTSREVSTTELPVLMVEDTGSLGAGPLTGLTSGGLLVAEPARLTLSPALRRGVLDWMAPAALDAASHRASELDAIAAPGEEGELARLAATALERARLANDPVAQHALNRLISLLPTSAKGAARAAMAVATTVLTGRAAAALSEHWPSQAGGVL